MDQNTFIIKPQKKNEGVFNVEAPLSVADCKRYLTDYSSISSFEDDQWILDKQYADKNQTNSQMSIYFSKVQNDDVKTEFKIYSIKLLLLRRSNKTIKLKLSRIRNALCFIKSINRVDDISAVDLQDVYENVFAEFTKHHYEMWTSLRDFFKKMGHQDQYYVMKKYVLPPLPESQKKAYKLIPDSSAKALDSIMLTREDIPTVYKAIYWTMRLEPNRIDEILSMTINCLKRLDEHTFMLSIPTFKQSGQFEKGTLKMIEINDVGVGHKYIELIQKQIEYAKKVTTFENNPKNMLFIAPIYYSTKQLDEQHYRYGPGGKTPKVYSTDSANYFIKKLCIHENIFDEDGKPILLTTHMFRHNAISDRSNSGIFRSIDIEGLTYHHNTQMIDQTYTHVTKEDLKKNAPVKFRGRILNENNPLLEQRIMKKPFAMRIHNLGICSDIRTCDKDKSQCLRCKYFIPDVDDLDYYQHDRNEWIKKKEKADKIGNTDFAELCAYWIESYNMIIQRIIDTVSNEHNITIGDDE